MTIIAVSSSIVVPMAVTVLLIMCMMMTRMNCLVTCRLPGPEALM